MKLRLSLCLLLASLAWAQPDKEKSDLKSYDSVITKEAKSSQGLFKVHRIGEKLYYEIPKKHLDKDLLLVTQIAKGRLGVGQGGADPIDQRVVRWERRDNKVLLMDIDYTSWADPHLAVAKSLAVANNPTILQVFTVEAESPEGSPVIEVSKLYLTDVLELSPKQEIGAKSFDRERCFLEKARAFPENIEVESTLTMANPDPVTGTFFRFGGGHLSRGTASVRMHYSMVKLPEQPMMPRLFDSRVGYFETTQKDYGRTDHYVRPRHFITRWRLEKKDPGAALSEPLKPIIFYVDPGTPSQWVPWIKKGIEDWQPAFEEAGYKNAIIAKDPPSDDPDWSPEDARYSVIRWISVDIANAYGPRVCDPRTGEILEADIHMFHNVQDLIRRWYFTQAGHLDPRCRNLPLSEELMGRLIEYVVCHEVGHSLGFQHNMRSSSTYPLEKVRDREWVKKMGHCPSIMDYSRFNYVAQPEDKIDIEDLVPRIGPYDRWAICWGYKPIAGATSPDLEQETLDRWSREQDKDPWKRFSNLDTMGLDPGDQTEAVGDSDPVTATQLGFKSLHRVEDILLGATLHPGEPYDDLRTFYVALLNQWGVEAGHVLPIVGGVVKQEKHGGQPGVIYTPIGRERQKKAVDFLLTEFFQPQSWLQDKEIAARISAVGTQNLIAAVQQGLLSRMLESERINRMAGVAADNPKDAYSPRELMDAVRHSFFAELFQPHPPSINHPRRQLQRALLERLLDLQAGSGESRALARQQLQQLRQELSKHKPRFQDSDSRAHLAQLEDDLVRELDPHASPRRITRSPLSIMFDGQDHGCWFSGDYDALKALLDPRP